MFVVLSGIADEQKAAEQAKVGADAAAEHARAELVRAREQCAGEADRLRQDLAAAGQQLGDVRAQLTVAQAASPTAEEQAQAAETQAADLLRTLRNQRT